MDSDDLEWLAGIGRAGSLSAIAKSRGVAVSTVARRLDALEALLKVRLVDRRPDGATLTDDGARIVALAEPLLASADRIKRTAAAMRAGEDRPPVMVSATEFIVAEVLAPAIPLLQASAPSVVVTLKAQTELVSLASRDADIAIRMSRPKGNSLVARKLPIQRLGMFASRDYLTGREAAPFAFEQQRLLSYDDSYGPIPEVEWIRENGLTACVTMRSGSTHALLNAVAAGAGIALLPTIFAKRADLIEIDAPFELPVRTAWVIAHRDLRRVPQIDAVHRWILAAFGRVR